MEKLNEMQELEMIAGGNHKKIMAYIKDNFLSDKAEKSLIKRGNSDEIMAYISQRPLSEKAEIALIKRGKHKEIMHYIIEWPWPFSSSMAEGALLVRGNQEEIDAYQNGQSLS